MKKVDRNQWFVIGLKVLENDGFSKITIDNLCTLLEIFIGMCIKRKKQLIKCR